MSGSLIIQQPGNSVVTDLGRFRGPRFGLPVNGALDQFSARAANILAGNDDNAPLLEITALDFRMRATTDILIAVTGAPLHLTVGGRECQQWEPVSVRAGETVALRRITGGLRAYLAVHGSVEAPVLLGSCAPDTVVGFGLRLAEGTELKTSRSVAPIRQPYFDLPLFRLGLTRPEFSSQAVVEVTDGPGRGGIRRHRRPALHHRIHRQRPEQPHRTAPRRGPSRTPVDAPKCSPAASRWERSRCRPGRNSWCCTAAAASPPAIPSWQWSPAARWTSWPRPGRATP